MFVAHRELLKPGETLGEPWPVEPGDAMSSHGYGLYPIEKPGGDIDGNSVLIDISPGGCTEPLFVRGGITLEVAALRGLGLACVYDAIHRQTRARTLAPHEPATLIGTGDVYYYVNTGEEPLVLRDDCQPSFQPTDEVDVLRHMPGLPLPPEFLRAYVDLGHYKVEQ